jgi:hypothetical protein
MSRRRARRPSSARGASSNDKNSRPEPLIREPADHAIGRSRGGLTTKVHALTDGAGRILVVLLTGGNVHDTVAHAARVTGWAASVIEAQLKTRNRTR